MSEAATPKIVTHIENDDPGFVAVYDLASHAVAVLQDLLKHLWQDNWYAKMDTPKKQALFKFVGIHGTLAWEAALGAKELSLNGLPRAMNTLTRSTFEYSVRLRYLHKHPDYARKEMDCLPAATKREAESASKSFSSETRAKLRETYEAWEKEHPDLAKGYSEVKFTPMAREVLGEHFEDEWWHWYSLPSIIAHSKVLAISDTMQVDEEHHIITLMPNSRHFDVNTELVKIASVVAELVGFITTEYEVDARPYLELNKHLSAVMADLGLPVKTHKIGRAGGAEPNNAT